MRETFSQENDTAHILLDERDSIFPQDETFVARRLSYSEICIQWFTVTKLTKSYEIR